MSIFRTPLQDGYICNGKLNDNGILFNNKEYIIKTGNFYNDKLHGINCIDIHYNMHPTNETGINIACGTFINDNKDGLITIYTFKKKLWSKFLVKTIVAKKEIYLYKNNVCLYLHTQSVYVHIKGTCVFDKTHNLITHFSFTEVADSMYSKVKKYFFTRSNN